MTSGSGDPRTAPLDISVTIDEDRAQLTVTGEIDLTNADDVLLSVHWHLDRPRLNHVVVDLSGLAFLDSAGLRVLMLGRRHADELGKTFRVQGQRGHIANVIEVTGLTEYLTDPSYRAGPR